MCVCVCIYIYIYTHTFNICIQIYINIYVHVCIYIYIYIYTHTHTHLIYYVCVCVCVYIYIYIIDVKLNIRETKLNVNFNSLIFLPQTKKMIIQKSQNDVKHCRKHQFFRLFHLDWKEVDILSSLITNFPISITYCNHFKTKWKKKKVKVIVSPNILLVVVRIE